MILYCSAFPNESSSAVCLFSCLRCSNSEHKAIVETWVPPTPGRQLSLSSVACLWESQVPFKMFMDSGFGDHLCLLVPMSACVLCSVMGLSLDMKSFSFYRITSHQTFGHVAGSGSLQSPHLCHFVSTLLLLIPSQLLICLLQIVLISSSFCH